MADPAGAPENGAEGTSHAHKEGFLALAVASVGVVFGDIGTSPLYAMRVALENTASGGADRPTVLGVVSLITWALILIVTIKYVVFLMRADNKGEGGTLALMALAQRLIKGRRSVYVFFLGVIGAALFYGDAVLTPAAAEPMRNFIGDLETHMVEGSGHWTQQEKPAEVNALILDWLDRRFPQ